MECAGEAGGFPVTLMTDVDHLVGLTCHHASRPNLIDGDPLPVR